MLLFIWYWWTQEGDLDTFLKKRRGQLMEEKEIMLLFVQICLGLQHVHSKARPPASCSTLVLGCVDRPCILNMTVSA